MPLAMGKRAPHVGLVGTCTDDMPDQGRHLGVGGQQPNILRDYLMLGISGLSLCAVGGRSGQVPP